MKTLWGLFLVILQMQVWGGIEEICARYTRPFTLLAMGVSVEQLAIKHPESVFVFFGDQRIKQRNTIGLRHKPLLEEWERLASCEHVDICLLSKEYAYLAPIVQTMSHIVVIDGEVEKKEVDRAVLQRTSYFHPKKLNRTYTIHVDYERKSLEKQRSDGWEILEWAPGINLMTYLAFDGVSCSRRRLFQAVPVDYGHRDYAPNNMIVQGEAVILIDRQDPFNEPASKERVQHLRGLLGRFIKHSEHLDLEQVKELVVSIYQWGSYFDQEEVFE